MGTKGYWISIRTIWWYVLWWVRWCQQRKCSKYPLKLWSCNNNDALQWRPRETTNVPNEPILQWPWYTNIVKGRSKEISLNAQHYELKLIIRKAFKTITTNIHFKNAFPTLSERFRWNRHALQNTSRRIAQWPSPASVQKRYKTFYQRLSMDDEYIHEISTIVMLH